MGLTSPRAPYRLSYRAAFEDPVRRGSSLNPAPIPTAGKYYPGPLFVALALLLGKLVVLPLPVACCSASSDFSSIDRAKQKLALCVKDVLGPVPGVGVMAKRSQGWVKCEDRLPYYRNQK
jgi:hypothetical protein